MARPSSRSLTFERLGFITKSFGGKGLRRDRLPRRRKSFDTNDLRQL